MRIIRDVDGGCWPIELNVYEFKRTRPTFGDLINPEYFWKKLEDAVFLCDLIFFLSDKTAAERKIDEATFLKKFKGDALDDARRMLLEEYVDFFPSRAGVPMRAALAKIEEAQKKRQELAKKELDEATKNLDETERNAETVSEISSTSSPESSESIPTAGRCGDSE